MYTKLEEVKEILKKYNQEQLLNSYDKLNEKNKEKLLNQILNIDFDLISKLYENTKKEIKLEDANIEPISYIDKEKLSKEEYEKYEKIGRKVIEDGHYAVVTMAGGQGTRLGHKAPKGTFNIGEGIEKSLFEALSDTIKEANIEYNVEIPWYIMTSRENNNQTVEFFESHNYFGFNKNNVVFFKQGELPMVDTNGKILVDENGMVKEAADGHGGVFESMVKNHIIDDMKNRKIEWIFIAGVDNILAKMIDPIATGLAISKGVLATGKSVVKRNPEEKVGVFCKKNGRPYVIEYTEIDKKMAEEVDENGELLYGESHIITNLFNIKAIENLSKDKLPYHSAFKKAKYINEKGELVNPSEPNAFKFEAFIFDAFERLEDMAILRVKREEEFAPVKNAEGLDSPETARKLYLNYMQCKNKNNIQYQDVAKVIVQKEDINNINNVIYSNEFKVTINNIENLQKENKIKIKQIESKVAAKNVTDKDKTN